MDEQNAQQPSQAPAQAPDVWGSTPPAKQSNAYMYLAAVVVILAVAAAYVYVLAPLQRPSAPVSTTVAPSSNAPSATTSVAPRVAVGNVTATSAVETLYLVNVSGAVGHAPPSTVISDNRLVCNTTSYSKYYTDYPAVTTTSYGTPFNFSQVGPGNVLFFSIGLHIVPNASVGNYTRALEANGGYCSSNLDLLRSNSTFSSKKTYFDGYSGYDLTFSNLTDNGILVSTGLKYSGARPDLVVYVTEFMYKNLNLGVSVIGPAGTTNRTLADRLTALLASEYSQAYP